MSPECRRESREPQPAMSGKVRFSILPLQLAYLLVYEIDASLLRPSAQQVAVENDTAQHGKTQAMPHSARHSYPIYCARLEPTACPAGSAGRPNDRDAAECPLTSPRSLSTVLQQRRHRRLLTNDQLPRATNCLLHPESLTAPRSANMSKVYRYCSHGKHKYWQSNTKACRGQREQLRHVSAAAEGQWTTHLVEANLLGEVTEAPAAQHHVVLADQTVVVAAAAAAEAVD